MSTRTSKVVAIVAGCGALLTFTPTASAVDEVNTQRLREQVTVTGILQHMRQLQNIANRYGGTRASGRSGYNSSAAYVERRLTNAGYNVRRQWFTFDYYQEVSSSLSQVSPDPTDYETGPYEYSGSGDVTGRVVPTNDIVLDPPGEGSTTDAGCESGDFTPASTTADEIALIQRGTCTFKEKADNAVAAGYDAVIIFNEGQPGRQELFLGTLGAEDRLGDVPILGLSYADGEALVEQTETEDVVLNATADVIFEPRRTSNVIADSRVGDPGRTVVVGAHLDSVVEGPGINDNGSGSAGILEIAEEMAENDIRPRNRVRFAFWGAEESGLLGSQYYVDSLSSTALQSLFANLNFDMIGSPNYIRMVYDGNGDETVDPTTGEPAIGPPGSGQIESLFKNYYAGQGLETTPTPFDQRSDYDAFASVGVPAGGLFSGAEGIKTEEEEEIYGGTAGEQYDPCYHEACDTIANLSTKALFELGDGAAHAVLTLARTRTGFFEDGSRRAARRGTRKSSATNGPHALK